MKKKMFLLPLVVLFLVGLACNAGTGTDTGPTADPNILFQDDFSSSSSGWDSVRNEDGMTDYDQGGYRIQVLDAQSDYWANPGLSGLGDVSISVEVKKLSGPDDNDFAVICRYVDIDNFYAFLASSDGYYGITKVVGAEQELIGQEELLPTDAITLGADAVNTLRADCVGNTLTLYINGTQVAQVQDSTFNSGDVGLLAGTFDTAGTDVLFDNFIVRKP
jgi:pectate lyase